MQVHAYKEPEGSKENPSEELYRILFEQAGEGIFIADVMGKYIEVNPRGCEMLGYSREEILQFSMSELVPEEDILHDPLHIEELRTGKVVTTERRLRHKDGRLIPVEISGKMLSDGKLLGLVRDISDRKKLEEEEIFQLSRFPAEDPNPVMRLSNQGQILYANAASRELLEEIGAEVGGVWPSEWREKIRKLASSGAGKSLDVTCKERVYSLVVSSMPGTENINLYGSDVTERKRSEDALREAEEKYHNIFSFSLDGIFQSTPSGRFIAVNPALASMWGYDSPEDLINQVTNIAVQIYVKPEQRNDFLRAMETDEKVHGFEFQVYRKDGSMIWVQESVRAVRDKNSELQYFEGTIRDITNQKQAEEFLRRSEERYRRTLNNMLEGCQIIDYDWRYIYINDAGAKHGRRKPVEFLMHTMPELYPGIEETELFAVLKTCMEDRKPSRIENHFIFPDGDKGWFELSIEPVPEGLFILSVDITERKNAEAALKQSQMFLEEAQRLGRLGSWDWDADQDIITWSEEYYRIYAFDPSQQPPSYEKHLESYTAESAARLDVAVKKALETGEPYELDLELSSTDGKGKWITAQGEVKRDSSGRITGLRGTAQDITERKQAEKELQEREVRYRTLFENLPIPVFTKDLEGRYTSFNDEESKYWNKSPIGHTDYDLLPFEIADPLRKHDSYVMETGESWFGEETFQSPSGLKYTLSRKVPLYNSDRSVIGILGASLDITERKEAEKKRQEAEQFAQSTIDALTAHICVLDEAGQILSVNRSWHEFAESNPPVPSDHFIGANYLAVCDVARGEDEAVASSFANGLRDVMQNKQTHFSLEYPCNVPDGEKRWFVAHVTRFEIEHKIRIVVSHENISKRKLMEEALRDSEARFSTVFRSSPLSITLTRLADNRLVDVNHAWVEATGCSRKEAIGHTAFDLGLWHDTNQRRLLLEQLQNQGKVQEMEVQLHKRSGEVREVLFSAEFIELSGEAHMLSMSIDISERKQAEKKVKEQLNRLIALSEIDQVISSSLDLDFTLNQLIGHLVQQLEVDAAAILLADSTTNTLEYIADKGFLGTALKNRKLHYGEGFPGKVALERKMIYVPNMETAGHPFAEVNITKNENLVGYYGLPLVAKGQLKGVLEVFQRRPFEPDDEWLFYLSTLAKQAAIAIDNAQLFSNLQQINTELSLAYDATIEGWSYALDLRDKETEGHTQRVADMTTKLCKKFGWSEKDITNARWGALLHDIGKMGIPDAILQKPEKLSQDEWDVMKKHPVFARNMLERISYLKSAIDIPYCHHEKWDGTGYPRGLSGEQIPFAARIFAIVDAWDALTSDRPYRRAWSKVETLEYIKSMSGKHFDPQVVRVFLESENLWNS